MCICKLNKKQKNNENVNRNPPLPIPQKESDQNNNKQTVQPKNNDENQGDQGGIPINSTEIMKDNKNQQSPELEKENSIKSGASKKSEKKLKPISPPKVVFAKREPKGTRDAKDPAYATLDGDYPVFELAHLTDGQRKGGLDVTQNSQKSQKTA